MTLKPWQLGCLGLALVVAGLVFGCLVGGLLGSMVVGPRVQTALGRTTKEPAVATEAPSIAPGKPTVAPTPTPSRCVMASAKQMALVQAGVQGAAPGSVVRSGWAVRSNHFQNVWMVAALVYGPGMEQGGGPGVWAIGGDPDNPVMALSVNGSAKQLSNLPDATQAVAQISESEDGVAEALACVEAFR